VKLCSAEGCIVKNGKLLILI